MPAVPGATRAPVPTGKASRAGASTTSATRRTVAAGASGIAAASSGSASARREAARSGAQASTRRSAGSSSTPVRTVQRAHSGTAAEPAVPSVMPVTSAEVRRSAPPSRSSASRASGRAAIVGLREWTRVPAVREEPPRRARTARTREPWRASPACSCGEAVANSRVRGSAECTPPTTGATRRRAVRRPSRRETTCSTLAPGRWPRRAGSSGSAAARRAPGSPSTVRASRPSGRAGMPSREPAGARCTPASETMRLARPARGSTTCALRPREATRASTAPAPVE